MTPVRCIDCLSVMVESLDEPISGCAICGRSDALVVELCTPPSQPMREGC